MSGNVRWLNRLSAGILGILCVAAAGAANGQERPEGVTDSTIALGRTLYTGKGNCATCHGEEGSGTPEGASLTSGPWKVGSGSYEGIIHVVRHSGIAARGRDGDPLPMRGPTLLSPDEVRSVAAYVWSISGGKTAQAKE
jgi:mono/diheme cytochrome c family protein